MGISLTGTNVTFNDSTTQSTTINNFALGVGQTWTDVAASRAIVTTYTNNTGRPIMVYIAMAQSTSNACVFDVDGVTVSGTAHNGGNGNSNVQCIVPAGSTYRISNGSWPFVTWMELR
jgi:hypothetical protein